MSLKVKGNGRRIELVFSENLNIEEALKEIDTLKNDKFFVSAECEVSYSGLILTYDEEIKLFERVKNVFGENCVFNKKCFLSEKEITYSLNENENISLVVRKSLRSGESVVS